MVTVHDVGVAEDRAYVAMEFVEGTTQAGWLRAEEREPHDILRVFVAAGRGLAAAHRAGLVHRDFKPANVLVAYESALEAGKQAFEHQPESLADIYNNLGTAYAVLGDTTRAAENLKLSAELSERRDGPQAPRMIDKFANLARLAQIEGDPVTRDAYVARAESLVQRAREACTQTDPPLLSSIDGVGRGGTTLMGRALDVTEPSFPRPADG